MIAIAAGLGYLNSYLSRIKPSEYSDLCPKCGGTPHTTNHLFNCPANPTNEDPRILWEDPPAAAVFLGLETDRDPGRLDDND